MLTRPYFVRLPYVFAWLVSSLRNPEMIANELAVLHTDSRDEDFVSRELTFALGRARHVRWFRSLLDRGSRFSPWHRRAFALAAHCLPASQWNDWVSNLPDLDIIEKSIIDWLHNGSGDLAGEGEQNPNG